MIPSQYKPRRESVMRTMWTKAEIDKYEDIRAKETTNRITQLDTSHLKTFPLFKQNYKDNNPLIKTNNVFDKFYDDDFPSLQDELDTPINGNEITTIDQKILYPLTNPNTNKEVYPRPNPFLSKKIRHCRKCNKPVVTPKMTISSIYEWLVLLADNSPKLTIKKLENFNYDQEAEVIINFNNNTKYSLNIGIKPISDKITQNYNLTKATLTSKPDFSIKSQLDVDLASSKETSSDKKVEELVTEESLFKVGVKKDETKSSTKFGFHVVAKLDIDEGVILNLPIIINLGKPSDKQQP